VDRRRREDKVPDWPSLLPEGGRVRIGMPSGARVRLSLLVLIFMLTTFPEHADPGFASVVEWNLSVTATLWQVSFDFKNCVKRTAMYKHTNTSKIYKTTEYQWCRTECFSLHSCSNMCFSKSLIIIPAYLMFAKNLSLSSVYLGWLWNQLLRTFIM
jgi:hypothetical protein